MPVGSWIKKQAINRLKKKVSWCFSKLNLFIFSENLRLLYGMDDSRDLGKSVIFQQDLSYCQPLGSWAKKMVSVKTATDDWP